MTDPRAPWAAYVPHAAAPWDLGRVVRLHRRAGFAATWDEIRRDLAVGPEASIDRLLSGTTRARGVPEHFEKHAAGVAVAASDPGQLKAWWVYRMLFGPDPLGERLVLDVAQPFRHQRGEDQRPGWMRRQNETFRRHARAPFGELLRASVREPALLVWLDAQANHKRSPNENLARELMELFTVGIGHYTETDVKESARALTGWTVNGRNISRRPGPARRRREGHPGSTGAVDGNRSGGDAARAAGHRRASGVADLRNVLRGRRHRLSRDRSPGLGPGRPAISTSAGRSAPCYGHVPSTRGATGAVVSLARSSSSSAPCGRLSCSSRAQHATPGGMGGAPWAGLVLPAQRGRMAGWSVLDSSAGAIIGRTNFAAALAGGRDVGLPGRPDVLGQAERLGFGRDLGAVASFASSVLLGVDARTNPNPWPDGALRSGLAEPDAARRILSLVLSSPQAQKC